MHQGHVDVFEELSLMNRRKRKLQAPGYSSPLSMDEVGLSFKSGLCWPQHYL